MVLRACSTFTCDGSAKKMFIKIRRVSSGGKRMILSVALDRETADLLRGSADERLPEGHWVWTIVDGIDDLDGRSVRFGHAARSLGAYGPALLLDLFIYGCVSVVLRARRMGRAVYDSAASWVRVTDPHANQNAIALVGQKFPSQFKTSFVSAFVLAWGLLGLSGNTNLSVIRDPWALLGVAAMHLGWAMGGFHELGIRREKVKVWQHACAV